MAPRGRSDASQSKSSDEPRSPALTSWDYADPLMTLPEVVAYLRLSERWVYEQARLGTLPAIRIARTYRFRKSDVDAFVEGFRVTPDLDRVSS